MTTTFGGSLSRVHHDRAAPSSPLPNPPAPDASVDVWLGFLAQIALRNRDDWTRLRHEQGRGELRDRIGEQLGGMLLVSASISPPFPPGTLTSFDPNDSISQAGVAGAAAADAGNASWLLRHIAPPDQPTLDRAWHHIRRTFVNVVRLAEHGGIKPISPTFSGPQLSREWQQALGVAPL